MKKRPDLTDATRNRFIEAFCELYKDTSIEKITVKNIAEKAGHNRVTFYQYFGSTYDVLDYMEKETFAIIEKQLDAGFHTGEIFSNYPKLFLEVISNDKVYLKPLLSGPNAGDTINRIKDRLIPLCMKEYGISEDNVKARHLFEFYFSGAISVGSYWIKNGQQLSESELAQMIDHILHYGIQAQL